MRRKQQMLDALVSTIEKHHRESVALAVVYGSYVTGQTSPTSDLDIVAIGKDERAAEMQRTFIFEGVGYDFWCMPMDRMQRIVAEFGPLVSIFAGGRLIYADSSEREAWFTELQHQLRTASQDTRPTKYARQIEELLGKMKALTFDRRAASSAEIRHIQGKMVLLAGDLLARVNRTYFRSGIKWSLEEISSFELKPKSVVRDLELMIRDVLGPEELTSFVLAMQEFWSAVKRQYSEPLRDDDLRGFYEEALSTWNKIDYAASRGDLPLTVLAAACLEDEFAGFRAQGLSLTSMFAGCPTESADIARNGEINRREFAAVLKQRAIPILEFDDIADVIRHIQGEE